MKVLHLQIRNDGAVRVMLNEIDRSPAIGIRVKRAVNYGLAFDDETAREIYDSIFARKKIDEVCVRVWRAGRGWARP